MASTALFGLQKIAYLSENERFALRADASVPLAISPARLIQPKSENRERYYRGSAASTSGSTLAAYLAKFSRKRPARSWAVVT
jgi:hypothetical protein